MPPSHTKKCDLKDHRPIEPRPGYFECERCGYRWILRAVLPDGCNPTPDDIDWLHHRR